MEAPALRIMCPNLTCKAVLSVPAIARGRVVRCRNCGSSIRVPTSSGSGEAKAPAPEAEKNEEQRKAG